MHQIRFGGKYPLHDDPLFCDLMLDETQRLFQDIVQSDPRQIWRARSGKLQHLAHNRINPLYLPHHNRC